MSPLTIKVKPAAAKDEISFDADGTFTVKIKERPINSAANAYLIKLLSEEFRLPKSSIILEKGKSSRFKKMVLAIDQDKLNEILEKYSK